MSSIGTCVQGAARDVAFEHRRQIRRSPARQGMTVLAGLLVCFRGLTDLARSTDPFDRKSLEDCLEALHGATIGAVMEMSPPHEWSRPFYERMTALKNVDFWRALYAGLDRSYESPLYPFSSGITCSRKN